MKYNLILLASITFIFSSCSNEPKKKDIVKPKISKAKIVKEVQFDCGNFKYGNWKIDSVEENNIIIDRLINDSVIQVMNFRKNGVFSTKEATVKCIKDRVVGTWKVKEDSVFILNEKNEIEMKFTFKNKDSKLALKGDFQVSATKKKNPIFYLSKYYEPFDEHYMNIKKLKK